MKRRHWRQDWIYPYEDKTETRLIWLVMVVAAAWFITAFIDAFIKATGG